MRIQFIGNSIKIGKLWIGFKYDLFIILFVMISYFCLQYYFFYFFSSEYVVCSVLNCISTLLFAYNYLNGTFREPGIIKKLQQQDEDDHRDPMSDRNSTRRLDDYFKERFCQVCKIMRPPKTSHCHLCNNCVKLYDHHCNFMGNCIGIRNYKYFIGWVYTLVFQCIVWYTVMVQHFFQKMDFSELYKQIESSREMQIITISLILALCYFMSCFFSKLGIFILEIIIIALIIGFVQQTYDTKINYYDNFYCSLFFIILTFPGFIFSISVSFAQSFHLAVGVNQKEWSVLEKQYNSQDFNSIELQPNQQQQDASTFNVSVFNNQIDIEEQNLQRQEQDNQFIQNTEDQILREKVMKEINENPNLQGIITPELIEVVFIQRKKYEESLKYKQQVKNTIIQHKQRATFQNYYKNLIRLFIQEIPKSELD